LGGVGDGERIGFSEEIGVVVGQGIWRLRGRAQNFKYSVDGGRHIACLLAGEARNKERKIYTLNLS